MNVFPKVSARFLSMLIFTATVWHTTGSENLYAQEDRVIRVFVALCDNATQGIVKVGAKIGNGDDAASNLYWGCSDGLRSYFKKSAKWNLIESEKELTHQVMERLRFRHAVFKDVVLVADAYRGSEMRACVSDFLKSASDPENRQVQLVAFIGHNGLMDHPDLETPLGVGNRDAIVLSCLSQSWFANRLDKISVRPVLMTRSLMYPGSFLLHDALEGWLRSESKEQIRERAAKAYARNQKISVKSARTIFAKLEDPQ